MIVRRCLVFLLLSVATLAAAMLTALLATLATLAPGAADWTLALRISAFGHPLERKASVPVLLRLATHPLALRAIDGHHIDTDHGRWQLSSATPEGLVATCTPCRISLAALGPAPLVLEQVQMAIGADGADHYHGTLRLGQPPHTLALPWRGHVDRRARTRIAACRRRPRRWRSGAPSPSADHVAASWPAPTRCVPSAALRSPAC